MLLQSVLDASLDSIITINRSGIIESANLPTWRMFGYEPGELIRQNVKVLMPAAYRDDHDQAVKHYLETGVAKIIGIGREVVCRRKDETTFPAELSVTEIDGDGTSHLFVGTIRDISERKEMETRLQYRERELAHMARLSTVGEMAAGLAHELNQPLGAISNFAGNCLHRLERGDLDEIRNDLEEVIAMTAKCGEIIRGIRRYLKKREPRRETMNLNASIANVLALIKRDTRLNGILVRRETPDESLCVLGDPIQIEQVLLNLTRNAIEAMAASPRRQKLLSIRVEAVADHAELSVRDTGDGIPPNILPRIGEPFISSKHDGLGMGLSICRTIIESHCGTLLVDAGDCGTCVRFRLPLAGHACCIQ